MWAHASKRRTGGGPGNDRKTQMLNLKSTERVEPEQVKKKKIL